GNARFRITEAQRAAGAEMAERPFVGSERALGLGELETDAKPTRAVVDEVVTVDLFLGAGRQRGIRKDSDTIDGATVGGCGVNPRDATCVAMAIGRRHLGRAPTRMVHPMRTGEPWRIPIGVPVHQGFVGRKVGGRRRVAGPKEFRNASVLRYGQA